MKYLAMTIAVLLLLLFSGACADTTQEVEAPNFSATAMPQEEVAAEATEPIDLAAPAVEPLDPTLFISEDAAAEAVKFIEQTLAALKNNDVATYKAAYLHDFTFPDNAVISLETESVSVDWQETAHHRDMYSGSELANHNGWSDEYLLRNFIVVHALYTVDYDNTKVPNTEGHLSHYLFLTRDDEDAPWKIWDGITPWEIAIGSDGKL